MHKGFEEFLEKHAKKAGKVVPARLQAAMALLERLREHPSLKLADHRAQGSSGVKSHETFGNLVHKRLDLQAINKNHGRRSCNLNEWGQALLDQIEAAGFTKASVDERTRIISEAQELLAKPLRDIIEQEPLVARIRSRSAESIIHDLLLQAEEKGKSGDVAQYLVGAKLRLRFNRDIPVHQANKSDRKSHFDKEAKLGDYEFENTVIEVAVGGPDSKHLEQIAEILDKADAEVWLLTRSDRVASWQTEIKINADMDFRRIVVTSVESFVGQNITELAGFSSKGKSDRLSELFDIYNSKWIMKVGTPGISIVIK